VALPKHYLIEISIVKTFGHLDHVVVGSSTPKLRMTTCEV